MKKRTFQISAFIVVLLLCCVTLLSLLSRRVTSRIVAQVGSYALTQSMVDYRDQVAHVFYPKEPSKVGLIQLIQAYTFAQILKNHGLPITDAALEQEEKRIDSQTKAPALLGQVKAIFGSDRDAYRAVFILPNLADRTLYPDLFLGSPAIQTEAEEKAKLFHVQVQPHPSQLMTMGKAAGYGLNLIEISKAQGIRWKPFDSKQARRQDGPPERGSAIIDQSQKSPEDMKNEKQVRDGMRKAQADETNRWIRDVCQTTPVGALYSNIIDAQSAWVVARALETTKTRSRRLADVLCRFEAVSVPKPDFSRWLERERAKVRVELQP